MGKSDFFKVESKTSRTHCEWISSTRCSFIRKLICISSDELGFVYTFENRDFTPLCTQKSSSFVTHMTVPSWAIEISEVKWLMDTDRATSTTAPANIKAKAYVWIRVEKALQTSIHCHPFSCFCLFPAWTQEATNLELRLPPYILPTQSKLRGQISMWHLHSLFKITLKNV